LQFNNNEKNQFDGLSDIKNTNISELGSILENNIEFKTKQIPNKKFG
jgi:hypothetical protein